MLKFTVAELAKYKHEPLHVTETLDVKEALMTRDPEILDVSAIQLDAYISADDGDFLLSATLAGSLTVPSTRSLEPVSLPLDFSFSEVYVQADDRKDKYENGELVITMEDDELDLQAAVLDHILLSIPMQVLTPQEAAGTAMPSGEDWEVVAEDDFKALQQDEKAADSPFAKLQGLFDADSDKKD
ncbi:YceD family protein [Lacticaseibacillus baoqingensis]|uniref:YceD family protein n=1 Tax=Lacticaseibacillus baoqingensis TaxID=2486013 RepID=A0ABW4E4G2_9LACO|nr:YceD family protein [Lacticaseibacillus baoqingensis]